MRSKTGNVKGTAMHDSERELINRNAVFDKAMRLLAVKVLPREFVYGDGGENIPASLGAIVYRLVSEIETLRKGPR